MDDALTGLAPLLRVQPELQQVCRFGAQWASSHAAESGHWAPFHLVTAGSCAIDLAEGERSIVLSAGDIAVLPHGSRHTVRGTGTPIGACADFGIRTSSMGPFALKTNTDSEPEAQLVCGRLRFGLAHHNLILAALPEVMVVSSRGNGAAAQRLGTLLEVIKEEVEGGHPGALAVATDLASALFVMVVRAHLEREGTQSGILRLLAHRQAARAVTAMLSDPARKWMLDSLAACASTSRASLVRMFHQTVGQSPLAFLAGLRLELARSKLSTSPLSVASIAAEVGYGSESALSRAYYRRFGTRPGEARRSAPAASMSADSRAE